VLPLPEKQADDYAQRKQQFVDGYKKALPDEKAWASQCQDCEVCLSKCPQQIRIPGQMARIVSTLAQR
jgi:predicted aldo/keto reductase-like oxidoreductase